MPIPDQFIDELVARCDISDVVSSYVHLTRKGANLWGLCPFHNEKTPSFSVSPDKQIYYCFGCGKGGGVISFVMEAENLPFVDAVRVLAQRAGLEVPEAGIDDTGRKKRARALAANKEAARFYHGYLKDSGGARVREYLAQRQISPRTAVRFGLGAAPDAWDVLTKYLGEKGFDKLELIDAGLAVAGKNGGVYDKFRARLMLPVIDVRGDVAGFTSRLLPGEEGAKYLNTPETVAFHKGRLVYALNFARHTKRPNLVLVEGNIDVITLHQAGFDNVVATMGTALTEDHARLLARYTRELVLCYDNDPAGKKSTDRVLNILKNANLNVRVLQLPNAYDEQGTPLKQDPDDFVKKFGPAAFEKCLSGSAEQNDYRLDTLLQRHDLSSDEGRRAYLQEAVETVAALAAGTAARTPQDAAQATLAPMLTRELSPMDWNRPAQELQNQVRGLIPWPAAVTELGGKRCKVFFAVSMDGRADAAPGTILQADKDGIVVACGGGTALRILELQPDGGKRMKSADYLRGHPLDVG